MSYTSSNTLQCFFCNCDLSTANQVQYVAEGPICSMCLAQMFNNRWTSESPITFDYGGEG